MLQFRVAEIGSGPLHFRCSPLDLFGAGTGLQLLQSGGCCTPGRDGLLVLGPELTVVQLDEKLMLLDQIPLFHTDPGDLAHNSGPHLDSMVRHDIARSHQDGLSGLDRRRLGPRNLIQVGCRHRLSRHFVVGKVDLEGGKGDDRSQKQTHQQNQPQGRAARAGFLLISIDSQGFQILSHHQSLRTSTSFRRAARKAGKKPPRMPTTAE